MLRKAFIFLLIIASIIPVSSAQNTVATSLELTLYSDGTVKTEYLLESDPTKVRVNLELFGSPFNNLVIKDEDGNPLKYTIMDSNVTIDTIGALELNIQYLTYTLTAKYGSLWELNFTSPTDIRIILPAGAAIVDLVSLPKNIGVQNEKTYLDYPDGDISLYYVLGLPSIAIDADDSITIAQNYITEKIADEYVIDQAVNELEQAENLYEEGSYLEAKNMAETALQTAEEIIIYAESAQEAINRAQIAIQEAEYEKRTTNLDAARTAYDSSITFYDQGKYSEAKNVANQAYQLALQADEKSDNENLTYYLILIGLILAVSGYFYLRRNKQTLPSSPTMKKGADIDLDKILNEHDLRLEDREVIRYMAESQGEVFASEIRDRFEMPRSTTWRLIQRLKDLEIIEEIMVGNQSLLRINSRYHREVE